MSVRSEQIIQIIDAGQRHSRHLRYLLQFFDAQEVDDYVRVFHERPKGVVWSHGMYVIVKERYGNRTRLIAGILLGRA